MSPSEEAQLYRAASGYLESVGASQCDGAMALCLMAIAAAQGNADAQYDLAAELETGELGSAISLRESMNL